MANELSSLVIDKLSPESAPIGAGMARRSRNTIALRNKYSKYVQEKMANGDEPMPFEQWVQTQEG